MKKIKMLMLLMVVVGNICLLGCGQKDDAETEIENESYGDYKNMPELSVEDNRITIVVYEDQALPYRWTYRVTDENIVLIEDKSVDDKDFTIQAGVSNSYRVFVFECDEAFEERIYLNLQRIEDYGSDVIEKRRYRVTYEEDKLICEKTNIEE